jgi:outer membrane protein
MQNMMRLSIIIFCLTICSQIAGQESWNLQNCIQYAAEQNIQVQLADIAWQQARVNAREVKMSQYPDLNGYSSYNLNFGRNIDPTTNDFESENLGYNNFGLSSSVPIYYGGLLRQQINQGEIDASMFRHLKDQAFRNIALQVTQLYLQVLMEYEQLENNNYQHNLTLEQLARVDAFIDLEMEPAAERYQWVAQAANDEQAIIVTQNNISIAQIQLKNLLGLDPTEDFEIYRPEQTSPSPERTDLEFEIIYGQALQFYPQIKADELRVQSAEQELNIARSSFMPQLDLYTGLNTNFSTLSQTLGNFQSFRNPVDGIFINGESVVFEETQSIPTDIYRTPYFDQLNENLSFGMGVQLSIPILNRGRRTAAIERAKLLMQNVVQSNRQNRNDLKEEVQQAITELKSARAQYEAAQRALESQELAYQHMLQQYQLGMTNSFQLLELQARMEQARNTVTGTKYNLIFQQKILDYLTGEELNL